MNHWLSPWRTVVDDVVVDIVICDDVCHVLWFLVVKTLWIPWLRWSRSLLVNNFVVVHHVLYLKVFGWLLR